MSAAFALIFRRRKIPHATRGLACERERPRADEVECTAAAGEVAGKELREAALQDAAAVDAAEASSVDAYSGTNVPIAGNVSSASGAAGPRP